MVESSNNTGSPAWFQEKAQTDKRKAFQEQIENLREVFIERFAPDVLAQMSGETLLEEVFGNRSDSMMRWLMYDDNYRLFGASGKYKYTGVIYHLESGEWAYKEGPHSEKISRAEAANRAELIIDKLLFCIAQIDAKELNTIDDYIDLNERLSGVFFSRYSWMIKYYQMIYPYYFAGMYADGIINIALNILGLPRHGSNRLVNVGELSLFIRKCDVNNIIFNDVYAGEWGWLNESAICQNASENYRSRFEVSPVNKAHYKLQDERAKLELIAKEIEEELDEHHLEGTDREAVVKVRVKQGVFREALLKRHKSCRLCGVTSSNLLVASHIKPWVASLPEQKLDPNNGLLLCPNHDKLFDQGYISFDENGCIMISNELSQNDRLFMNITDEMKIELTQGNKEYLEYHREKIFKH